MKLFNLISVMLQDDEFVVYNVNQQRLRYLVEFTVDAELPGAPVEIPDDDAIIDSYMADYINVIGM
jgi:hypothetical protein